MKRKNIVIVLILAFGSGILGWKLGTDIAHAIIFGKISFESIVPATIITLSVGLTFQGVLTLFWMLYAWENPLEAKKHRSPKIFADPFFSFTTLLPARHEDKVIGDTIRAIARIDYPAHLKELIVLCRHDDIKTIQKVQEVIQELGDATIRLEIFDGFPINKPYALNIGLRQSNNDIVTIFDAEDQPHPHLFSIVNTTLLLEKADIVQSGVQLMNYKSNWFSSLNCLEYFFWFKSGLTFFSRIAGTTPLGGNTVFFKREALEKIGGWDEQCLTEDADIGFRLTATGAKTFILYDEEHATQEETPDTLASFIKQRTRWNQGFLQVFFKYDWLSLPTLKQKLFAAYILLSPLFQALLFLYIPIAIFFALTIKLPILLSLFSFVPLFLFFLQLTTLLVGLHEFTKSYHFRFPLWHLIKLVFVFYPYQCVLAIAAVRGVYRFVFNQNAWEKTHHTNAHREALQYVYAE